MKKFVSWKRKQRRRKRYVEGMKDRNEQGTPKWNKQKRAVRRQTEAETQLEVRREDEKESWKRVRRNGSSECKDRPLCCNEQSFRTRWMFENILILSNITNVFEKTRNQRFCFACICTIRTEDWTRKSFELLQCLWIHFWVSDIQWKGSKPEEEENKMRQGKRNSVNDFSIAQTGHWKFDEWSVNVG